MRARPGSPHFSGAQAPHVFRLGSSVFRETFGASAEAFAALREFVAARETKPPWPSVAELAADGLVDRRFGVTARGRRALAQRARR